MKRFSVTVQECDKHLYFNILKVSEYDILNSGKNKLVEAYNTIAANYAETDKAKAKDYFGRTLALDPANAYASEAMKTLK